MTVAVVTILNLSLWIFTALGYAIYNLSRKNKQLEEMVGSQHETIVAIQAIIEESDRALKEIDKRGIYRSDDEVGTFFKTLQHIQGILNEFTKR